MDTGNEPMSDEGMRYHKSFNPNIMILIPSSIPQYVKLQNQGTGVVSRKYLTCKD